MTSKIIVLMAIAGGKAAPVVILFVLGVLAVAMLVNKLASPSQPQR